MVAFQGGSNSMLPQKWGPKRKSRGPRPSLKPPTGGSGGLRWQQKVHVSSLDERPDLRPHALPVTLDAAWTDAFFVNTGRLPPTCRPYASPLLQWLEYIVIIVIFVYWSSWHSHRTVREIINVDNTNTIAYLYLYRQRAKKSLRLIELGIRVLLWRRFLIKLWRSPFIQLCFALLWRTATRSDLLDTTGEHVVLMTLRNKVKLCYWSVLTTPQTKIPFNGNIN